MCPVPAATQQGRPSSPVPFSPSSFPTIPEQDQLLPELLPVSWLLSPLQTDHHFFFFFLHFKHPRKCKFNCTSHTLGRSRGLPWLPVRFSQPKIIKLTLSHFKLEELLMYCLACWDKETAKKIM